MSDSGIEVATAAFPVLPKEVSDEIGSIKLFNKWSYEDVEIKDISLTYADPITFYFTVFLGLEEKRRGRPRKRRNGLRWGRTRELWVRRVGRVASRLCTHGGC